MGKEVEGRGKCEEHNAADRRRKFAIADPVAESRIGGVAFRLGRFESLNKHLCFVLWWRAFLARQSQLEFHRGLFGCGNVGIANAFTKLPFGLKAATIEQ